MNEQTMLPLQCTRANLKIPKRPTTTMLTEAVSNLVDRLIRAKEITDEDRDASIAEIVAECQNGVPDGYNLAKALEDRYYWDCDIEMAKTLDSLSIDVNRLLRTAQHLWAQENPVELDLPNGTIVRVPGGEQGVIVGVASHRVYSYLVQIAGMTGQRLVYFDEVKTAGVT